MSMPSLACCSKLNLALALLLQTRCPFQLGGERTSTPTHSRSGAPLLTPMTKLPPSEAVNFPPCPSDSRRGALVRRGRLQGAVLAGQPLLFTRRRRPKQRGHQQSALPHQRGELSVLLWAGLSAPASWLSPVSWLCRGGCLDRRTTGAEGSRSWSRVRPTGSGWQASTALAEATLAPSASSRPASPGFLERPLLLKSQRCGCERRSRLVLMME